MKVLKVSALFLAIVITLILYESAHSVFAADVPQIMVNNQYISGNTKTTYYNNIIMAPAKEIMEDIGGSFSFDSGTMTGKLKQGSNEMVFRLDDSVVNFNGKYFQAPAPMKITGFRLLIPAEFVSRKFGAQTYIDGRRNLLLIFQPVDGNLVYKVLQGDTLWLISQKFGTTVNNIMQLNNLTGSMIYVGQQLVIGNIPTYNPVIDAFNSSNATIFSGKGFDFAPVGYLRAWTGISVTGKDGNWYKATTPKGNGYIYSSVLQVKQDISDNTADSTYFNSNIPLDTSGDGVTSFDYTVQSGDTIWYIAQNNGIPADELASSNNISLNTMLYIGEKLKIPVHNIPVKSVTGPGYGELLDWFKEAQYLFPIGKTGKFTDLETGASFMAKRTIGANHADTETLTLDDTQKMKDIFGGNWTWNKRPFLLEVDGRKFAVSVTAMPHAGVDTLPFLQDVDNRSDNWGYGPNYDSIKGNGMDGHFDVYFLNCLRHVDNSIDASHQVNVLISGGLN